MWIGLKFNRTNILKKATKRLINKSSENESSLLSVSKTSSVDLSIGKIGGTKKLSVNFIMTFFFFSPVALSLLEWVLRKQADIYGIATIL